MFNCEEQQYKIFHFLPHVQTFKINFLNISETRIKKEKEKKKRKRINPLPFSLFPTTFRIDKN